MPQPDGVNQVQLTPMCRQTMNLNTNDNEEHVFDAKNSEQAGGSAAHGQNQASAFASTHTASAPARPRSQAARETSRPTRGHQHVPMGYYDLCGTYRYWCGHLRTRTATWPVRGGSGEAAILQSDHAHVPEAQYDDQ